MSRDQDMARDGWAAGVCSRGKGPDGDCHYGKLVHAKGDSFPGMIRIKRSALHLLFSIFDDKGLKEANTWRLLQIYHFFVVGSL
jgi:hypothetical protein